MTDSALPLGDRDEHLVRKRAFFSRAPSVDGQLLERFMEAYERYKTTGRTDPIDHGDAWEGDE